jgi:hypothetical protein
MSLSKSKPYIWVGFKPYSQPSFATGKRSSFFSAATSLTSVRVLLRRHLVAERLRVDDQLHQGVLLYVGHRVDHLQRKD